MTPETPRMFRVVYAPELTPPQFVAERGELRIVPTPTIKIDEDAHERAADLCGVLNRIYGGTP